MASLCFKYLFCIAIVSLTSAEILNSTDTEALRSWFGNAGRDVLTQRTFEDADTVVDYSFSRPFASLPTSPDDGGDNWPTFGGHCCTKEMPIDARGLLNSSTAIGDPRAKPLITMMTQVAKHNLTLVFWGDSIMAQTLYAFVAELRRESLLHNLSLPESITAEGKKLFVLHPATTAAIGAMFRYMNVTIVLFRQNVEDQPPAVEFMSQIGRVLSTSVAVFANRGLHLAKMAEQAGNPGRETMYNLLEQFILTVKQVKESDENNVAVWMETTATHFNSRRGDFAEWETPNGYHLMTYNTWDPEVPLYHCRQHNESEAGLNRLDNLLMYEILQHHNLTRVLPVIEVHKHFVPHYRMHYGNCQSEGGYRTALMDCTHFCAYSPLMWAPIWRQIEQHMHAELQKPLARNHHHSGTVKLI